MIKDCPPDWGSTILAIANPAVDEIFSPAMAATENKILNTKATDNPNPTS